MSTTSDHAVDPILAAIERHRLADDAFEAVMATDDETAKGMMMDAEHRAFWGLVEVRPTTLRGIWALCDHLAEYGTRDNQFAERRDYDGKRNWRFDVKLLENIRDAVERIVRGGV